MSVAKICHISQLAYSRAVSLLTGILFMFDLGSAAAAAAPKNPSSHSSKAGHDMCIFAPLAPIKHRVNRRICHLLEAPNVYGTNHKGQALGIERGAADIVASAT